MSNNAVFDDDIVMAASDVATNLRQRFGADFFRRPLRALRNVFLDREEDVVMADATALKVSKRRRHRRRRGGAKPAVIEPPPSEEILEEEAKVAAMPVPAPMYGVELAPPSAMTSRAVTRPLEDHLNLKEMLLRASVSGPIAVDNDVLHTGRPRVKKRMGWESGGPSKVRYCPTYVAPEQERKEILHRGRVRALEKGIQNLKI